MLRVYAENFVESSRYLTQIATLSEHISRDNPPKLNLAEEGGAGKNVRAQLIGLREQCEAMQLRMTVKHINRLLNRGPVSPSEIGSHLGEVLTRYRDELTECVCFALQPDRSVFFEKPVDKWEQVIDRFGCAFDIEEARKCLAFGRYTAAVFHLMKVTEAGVLELQMFIGKEDIKAHFGSVINKLETLTQRTKHEDLPTHLQPYYDFMRGVLAQLHAVKDSWRNKVSHVDALIVPADTFTDEMSEGVHDATLLLMKKLAEGLPPKVASSAIPSPVSQSLTS